jgi:spore germination protein GerM
MTSRYLAIAAGILLLVVFVVWGVTRILEQAVRVPQPEPPPAVVDQPPPPTAHITATLFYGSSDGQTLVPVRREVPLAGDIVDQGRAILIAQLEEPAPEPHVSVIPEGTTLRAFYVTPRGDAFVDFSSEISTRHPGGSLTELLTVYAVVNAVTANLQAVQRVQILVDGREVDTVAGHVDVRRPLARDTSLVADTTIGER